MSIFFTAGTRFGHRAIIRLSGRPFDTRHPTREWPGACPAAWHLFGHVHGEHDGAPRGYSLNGGVDARGHRPTAVSEVGQVTARRSTPVVGGRRLVRPRQSTAAGDARNA